APQRGDVLQYASDRACHCRPRRPGSGGPPSLPGRPQTARLTCGALKGSVVGRKGCEEDCIISPSPLERNPDPLLCSPSKGRDQHRAVHPVVFQVLRAIPVPLRLHGTAQHLLPSNDRKNMVCSHRDIASAIGLLVNPCKERLPCRFTTRATSASATRRLA